MSADGDAATQTVVVDDPAKREPREAVGWMLGPDLIGRLAKILGKRRDPRGWMPMFDGFVHDEHLFCDGRYEDLSADRSAAETARGIGAVESQRRVASRVPELAPTAADVVWFDYFADAGDSGEAMYAVAVACLADLDCDALPESIPFGETRPLCLRLRPNDGPRAKLPRGQFLFVGGDTAYHVADAPTIRARVEEPFRWADADLDRVSALAVPGDGRRPARLYGIPGNHDWYDNLDGFRLAFQRDAALPAPSASSRRLGCRFLSATRGLTAGAEGTKAADPSRGLARFEKLQLASYVGIRLPHDWYLWGLDIDQPLDSRQKRYFSSLNGEPARLILATPSPPIAFGATIPTDEHIAAISELELTPAYVGGLRSNSRRLDLSGDMHHYARYANDSEPGYAAVVSGLGGAFHHPSFTMIGDHEPRALYPTAERSRSAVSSLLGFRRLFVGSWIRAFPFVFTMLLGAASTSGGGITWIVSRLLGDRFGHCGDPTLCRGSPLMLLHSATLFAVLLVIALALGFAVKMFDKTFQAQCEDPSIKRSFWSVVTKAPLRVLDPHRSYWVSTLAVVFAIALPVAYAACHASQGFAKALLDVGAFSVLLLCVGGGTYAGVRVGGAHRTERRARFGVLGLFHGAIQLATPLVCAHLVTASIPGLVAAVGVVLVQHLVLFPIARRPFAEMNVAVVTALAIASAFGGLAVLVLANGDALPIHHDALGWKLARYGAGALAATLFGTANLTWYFAVAGLLNGHNNEVGGAARVTCFRQIIRFRIDASGLTGYVIRIEDKNGAEAPVNAGKPHETLDFALVDVFRLET